MGHFVRLPGPVAHAWEWQLQGACREADAALFFHPERERGAPRRLRDAAAKAVCATCPVIRQCRAHALTTPELYGVWGGLSEDDREAIVVARDALPLVDRSRRSPVGAATDTPDAEDDPLASARTIPA